MPGPADDGREDSPGSVVSSEAGLAHAGAVVNDQGGDFVITHLGAREDKIIFTST